MPFGEDDIPIPFRKCAFDSPDVSEPIRPDQSAANAISHVLATAANRHPISKPYTHIDYAMRPWPPSGVANDTAPAAYDRKISQFGSPHPL